MRCYFWNSCAAPSTHHACSSNTTLSLAHRTTFWSIQISSTSPLRPSWILFSLWWIACTPNVSFALVSHNHIYHVGFPFFYSFFPRPIPGIPYITDCVMAEIEKLGMKYRVALRYKHNLLYFKCLDICYRHFFLLILYTIYSFKMQDSERSPLWAPAVHTPGNLRWWLLSPTCDTGMELKLVLLGVLPVIFSCNCNNLLQLLVFTCFCRKGNFSCFLFV